MPLSIIIVNYRSARLVLDCLEHLYRDPVARQFDVLVVDNASNDDSETAITTAFPQVRWIPMSYNSGFARANNEGIRRSPATSDAILLLNGDTLPDAAVIETAYRRLMDSAWIAAGVQLLNSDGSPQISGMYVMKGGLNYLLPLPFLGALIRTLGKTAKVKAPHVPDASQPAPDAPGQPRVPPDAPPANSRAGTPDAPRATPTPVEVDWINGAFLLVKRSSIDKAGLLDEDFFLYAEEAEWCSRLKKTGPLCIYGDLTLIHLQGETANEQFGSDGKGYYNLYDRKGLQIMLSNFLRIRKQFGAGWFLVQLFFYCIDIPVFAIGLCFSKKYSFAQFRQYCKNTGRILRLSPTILKNKPYFYKVL